MIIRFATENDKLSAIRSLQKNQTSYNTVAQLKEDIALNRLIVVENNGKLLAKCAIVEEPLYNYIAIKRLCVFSKKSKGKGIASALINHITSLNLGVLGATPWEDNEATKHILEKNGFKFQYTFLNNYCFYKRDF